MMVIQPVFPLFVESMEIPRLGLATTIGGLFALTGIAAMLAAPFWGKRNDVKGPKPTLITSLAGTAILSSAQAFARNAYGLGAVRLFLGLFTGGTSPATQAIIVQNCPPSRRGGVFGITTSAGLLGAFFGPIVGGFLAASIGIRPLFVLTGAILLGICPLVSVLVKKGKPDIQTRLKTN
jgi:DHA1 family multidrug resistance protein-like MFS transporter